TLELGNLRTEIKQREEEVSYLSGLLGEYADSLEPRLHIGELRRWKPDIEKARLAAESANMTAKEALEMRAGLVDASLERLEGALGGDRFEGTAVDVGGLVRQGTFAMFGPAGVFRSHDGTVVGTVETRLGSLEPNVVAFADPADAEAARRLTEGADGALPFDATFGGAHKIAETQETLLEHVRKGGPVMWPIFALAAAALIVVVAKWLSMAFVRKPSKAAMEDLLDAVSRRDREGAARAAARVGGPSGAMLAAGVAEMHGPSGLVEEVMYEKLLESRLRLQRMLPFVAITSAAAPLLGLLGTVTGIMNTFKLITVYGTGDPKTLSGGISEALITTEYGLIVAIPSLLLHALLSRKAKAHVDAMEKSAIAFMNALGRAETVRTVHVACASPTGASESAAAGFARV
ncbi:MAG TPA: MotA/TolQ/ExbB proton channel family protein, partial [Planctomycetota bacterium]|nr:MotA/TolQ/ExbB proton channel family protein [Planctomycetota bacterium]